MEKPLNFGWLFHFLGRENKIVANSPRKTAAYVDGYNLYYGRLRGTHYKWLDPIALLAIREDYPSIMLGVVMPIRPPMRDAVSGRRASGTLSKQADWRIDSIFDEQLSIAHLPSVVETKKNLRVSLNTGSAAKHRMVLSVGLCARFLNDVKENAMQSNIDGLVRSAAVALHE